MVLATGADRPLQLVLMHELWVLPTAVRSAPPAAAIRSAPPSAIISSSAALAFSSTAIRSAVRPALAARPIRTSPALAATSVPLQQRGRCRLPRLQGLVQADDQRAAVPLVSLPWMRRLPSATATATPPSHATTDAQPSASACCAATPSTASDVASPTTRPATSRYMPDCFCVAMGAPVTACATLP